jgi:plastocyanin
MTCFKSIRIVRMNVKQIFRMMRENQGVKDRSRNSKPSMAGKNWHRTRIAFVWALAFLLMGCGGGAPIPTSVPTATATMIFDPIVRRATPTLLPYPTSSPTPNDGIARIMVGDNYFEPAMVAIKKGTTVEWWHGGGHDHIVASSKSDWITFLSSTGGRQRMTFNTPGDYPYVCLLHSGMLGMIRVLN